MSSNSPEDFFSKLIELQYNYKNKYETEPASYFVEYLENDLGYVFNKKIVNEDDPPDFILITDERQINLEVTSLINELISLRNKFFRKVEEYFTIIFQKHKDLLPKGKYTIYYFPGNIDAKLGDSGKLTIPDYRTKISSSDFKLLLEKDILEGLKTCSDFSNFTIELHNKNNDTYGRFMISKVTNHDSVEFIFFPQGIFRIKEWIKEELQSLIQKKINIKESKYITKFDSKQEEWWLLISDSEDEMNTYNLKFDLLELDFKSNFFKKLFFINKNLCNYKVYELKINYESSL